MTFLQVARIIEVRNIRGGKAINTKPTDKKALIWLNLAHLVNDSYAGFLNPIMPFIAVKIGITMAIATAIMSVAQVCASMFQPIFGFFADNILKRFFIFWGLLLGSMFIPFAPIAPNAIILTILIILGNLGGSFYHPQAFGFLSKFSSENFAKTMGIFVSFGMIGFSIGPMVSAFIWQHFGYAKIPYLAIIGFVLALLMFKCVPKLSASGVKVEQKDFLVSFKTILSNKFMLILTVIAMMKSFVVNCCTILLPFLWKGQGHNPIYIGGALFLFLLMASLGSLLSAKIENLIGAKRVFYISMIATFPIMALFVATYKLHPYLSVGIFVMMGFITMLAQPVILVMAQRILPEYKSIVSGIINGFAWGVVAIFLTVVGFVAQQFGIAKVLLIVSFAPAIASVLIRFLPEKIEEQN